MSATITAAPAAAAISASDEPMARKARALYAKCGPARRPGIGVGVFANVGDFVADEFEVAYGDDPDTILAERHSARCIVSTDNVSFLSVADREAHVTTLRLGRLAPGGHDGQGRPCIRTVSEIPLPRVTETLPIALGAYPEITHDHLMAGWAIDWQVDRHAAARDSGAGVLIDAYTTILNGIDLLPGQDARDFLESPATKNNACWPVVMARISYATFAEYLDRAYQGDWSLSLKNTVAGLHREGQFVIKAPCSGMLGECGLTGFELVACTERRGTSRVQVNCPSGYRLTLGKDVTKVRAGRYLAVVPENSMSDAVKAAMTFAAQTMIVPFGVDNDGVEDVLVPRSFLPESVEIKGYALDLNTCLRADCTPRRETAGGGDLFMLPVLDRRPDGRVVACGVSIDV